MSLSLTIPQMNYDIIIKKRNQKKMTSLQSNLLFKRKGSWSPMRAQINENAQTIVLKSVLIHEEKWISYQKQ